MGTLVMIGAAVVVFVVIMPIVGTRWSRNRALRVPLRRAIAARETTPIAALRAGEVAKVRGVVVAREPLLTSPSSGRACIGYRVVIDDTSHDPSFEWIPLVSREAWPPFLVTDETGSVIVEGPLDVALNPSDFASNMNIPPGVYALLKEDDVRMRDLWGPRTFWCRETLLKVGDRVSVVGRPSLEIDAAGRASFRDPPRLHVMRGSLAEPIPVIDDDESPADQPQT
jgi:hypothetical protein